MQEIKCPHCGEVFQVDETGYAAILKQVRDKAFEQEVRQREVAAAELTKAKIEKQKDQELNDKLNEKNRELSALHAQLETLKRDYEAEKQRIDFATRMKLQEDKQVIVQLQKEIKDEKDKQETAIRIATQNQMLTIQKLEGDLQHEKDDRVNREQQLRERHRDELALKDEQIAQLKDFKARQSTKMIGESLEQHCKNEFDKIRMAAFPNAYFEKDNDARTGSKGDFIFRENAEDGTEIISIMFEMKNEVDTTSTKHKNEDFFKELDKDRKEKNCEYAVLVSLLEADSEVYNTGIVDVSYKYEKMYVIRPQFFIPLITLLRNAAQKTVAAKQELARIREQNIDVTNFEKEVNDFREKFAYNYEQASKRFTEAIEEIDKTITHLQKVKEGLVASARQLRLANDKAEDLSIKKLTKNNPTMQKMFEDLKSDAGDDVS